MLGKEYLVLKRGREYQDCGEGYNMKKGKGKQVYLPCHIKAVGEKKKSGEEGNGNFRGRKSKFNKKIGTWKNIKL